MVFLSLAFGPGFGGTSSLLAQVSPGPLARAHQSLEGATRCTSCHGGGSDGMSARCAACHKDIGQTSSRGEGYHGEPEVRSARCSSCHPDHAGADFSLIRWPGGGISHFDHGRTGWPLAQRHRELECAACHATRFRTAPIAALSARRNGPGWMGLDPVCTSCHEDAHRGALGARCATCHDASTWPGAPGFSHDSTAYPLRDRHRPVACAKCHAAGRTGAASSGPIRTFKPVAHAECSDCHRDPHAGKLGAGCAGCHTTSGFRVIDKDRFDHDRTRFTLTGRHRGVRCADCHGRFSTELEKHPVAATCGACHQDAHNGTATLAGRRADCGDCHSTAGFTTSTYTVAQHATRFRLDGKHAPARCATCHRRDRASRRWGSSHVVLRPAAAQCEDCHEDPHARQLVAERPTPHCTDCHRTSGWTPSTFSLAAHGRLRLPLDGRHAEIACRACHGAERKGLPPMSRSVSLGRASFLFHVAETTCVQCHRDPHGASLHQTARTRTEGCRACHDARAFRPSTVDVAMHSDYGFALEGAHRAVPCSTCHQEMKPVKGAASQVSFRASRDCASCHRSPHGTQFAGRADQGRCEACHGLDAFAPASRFDHARDANFSLKGAHERVPCGRCHLSVGGAAPVYKDASPRCEACHKGAAPR